MFAKHTLTFFIFLSLFLTHALYETNRFLISLIIKKYFMTSSIFFSFKNIYLYTPHFQE